MKTKSVHLLRITSEIFTNIYLEKMRFLPHDGTREFREGDELILQEFIPQKKQFTGRLFSVTVTFILEGGTYGILPGYVNMSVELITGVEMNMKDEPPGRFTNLLNEHD